MMPYPDDRVSNLSIASSSKDAFGLQDGFGSVNRPSWQMRTLGSGVWGWSRRSGRIPLRSHQGTSITFNLSISRKFPLGVVLSGACNVYTEL